MLGLSHDELMFLMKLETISQLQLKTIQGDPGSPGTTISTKDQRFGSISTKDGSEQATSDDELKGGDIAAALRGLEDLAPQILREGGGRAQPALVASMLRLADEAGEREQVLETLDLSARALSEVLFAEALLRDDLIDAAGFLLGMEQSGYAVTAELAAQLCDAGLRLGRLNEVVPVLSMLGLSHDELMFLMKLKTISQLQLKTIHVPLVETISQDEIVPLEGPGTTISTKDQSFATTIKGEPESPGTTISTTDQSFGSLSTIYGSEQGTSDDELEEEIRLGEVEIFSPVVRTVSWSEQPRSRAAPTQAALAEEVPALPFDTTAQLPISRPWPSRSRQRLVSAPAAQCGRQPPSLQPSFRPLARSPKLAKQMSVPHLLGGVPPPVWSRR
jgi:hypothetical protein